MILKCHKHFTSRLKRKWEAHQDLTQAESRWVKGLGKCRGKVRPTLTLRPRREHRSGESRLCGSGQNVLEEMTQLASGDLKVRT